MKLLPSILALAALLSITPRANAIEMLRYDLESLVFMSSGVIEGDVTAAKTVNWCDKLTVKVTTAFAGDFKNGDVVVVGLREAYAKAGKDASIRERFGVGDHLILFIEPLPEEYGTKSDEVPYCVVMSGLKLVADGKVTGVEQGGNPGPYENTVDQGSAKDYDAKIAAAVKSVTAFRAAFKDKKSNVAWLLEQLKARPTIKPDAVEWESDEIARTLCVAIWKTQDKNAIEKAKALRADFREREIFDLPPAFVPGYKDR